MPRTGKGGKRQGGAQTAYSNRTDLNNRGPQPITTAPGQAYGERQMQEDAQRAVPMGGTPMDASVESAIPSQPVLPAQNLPEPGTIPFDHPTERPDEPVTHGLPMGAGGGPEALGAIPTLQHATLESIMEAAARQPGAGPRVQALADFARMMRL